MDSQSGETKRKKKENEGSSLIILFLSSVPTCSVFVDNFRRTAQNVDKSHYPGPPHFSARFRFIRPRVKLSPSLFLSRLPDFSTVARFPHFTSKKKKKYLRSGALFELIKFERLLRLSEASISRCSSDRKRKIADGAVNMPVKFSVITRNWPRNRDASAVQRTCFLNN